MPILLANARPLLRLAAALVLGALHAAAFAPWELWWLQCLSLAGLASLLLSTHRFRQGASLGMAFGLGWFGVGVSWVYISMHVYGGMPAPIAVLATVVLALFQGSFPAIGGGLWAKLWGRAQSSSSAPQWTLILGFAACWGLSEWVRGWFLTGFPWIASGYAHTSGPLAGFAPWIGLYGLCSLAAAYAMTLARLHKTGLAVLVGFSLLGWASHHWVVWTQPTGRPISVRLLQGNISQAVKFEADNYALSYQTYLDMAEAQRADLIVAPETAIPTFLDETPPEVMGRLQLFASNSGSTLLTGIPLRQLSADGNRMEYYNSAVAITPEGAAPGTVRYDKQHLVPFGEFIPPYARWFVDLMHIPLGDFNRGALPQPSLALAGQRIAVNICYEDLFGEEIAEGLRKEGNASATLLVNLTNLAWFGDSLALPQHLQISRMRALETGRPVLRATNTGMTAVIDPKGRVLSQLPAWTRGSLAAEVRGYAGTTPYIRWGNSVALGGMIAAALIAAWGVRRKAGR